MRASALQRKIDKHGIASDGSLSRFYGHQTSRRSSGPPSQSRSSDVSNLHNAKKAFSDHTDRCLEYLTRSIGFVGEEDT